MFKHVSLIAVLAFSLFSSLAFSATKAVEKTDPANNQTPTVSSDDARKKIVENVCAACHGVDGNSAISINPKLAGQHPEYLLKQLTNFKDGTRANAVMTGMVANLTPEDMQNLATYFAAQQQTLAKAKTNGTGSLGEKIYRGGIAKTNVPACASCHGAKGAGLPTQFPRLAGQHADYTLQQLKIFRTGERANAPMMTLIAAKMTEAEMQAVADYMQGLR
ncbi:MAG: c-type cytochrome [Pseudomonadota bacterium]